MDDQLRNQFVGKPKTEHKSNPEVQDKTKNVRRAS